MVFTPNDAMTSAWRIYGEYVWRMCGEDMEDPRSGQRLPGGHMENIYGEYIWRICMENIYGEYVWRIYMENIYGEYIWRIYMENMYGEYMEKMWRIY